MKKALLVMVICCIVAFWFVGSLFRGIWVMTGHNVSLRIHETSSIYQLKAHYARNKTYRIQKFIDEQLHTDDVFSHARMNGDIILDDRTSLYVQTAPGQLTIRMNKRNNDPAAYHRIKDLGEKLKQKIAED